MPGKKILIVDDDPDLVHIFSLNLKRRGYQVATASDGEEGLAKVRSEKPDLIMVDIKMPKMDGYSFVRQLKQDEGSKKIPVIVLTAFEPMKDMFQMEGVQDYFVKSVNPEGLFAAIEKNLSSSRSS